MLEHIDKVALLEIKDRKLLVVRTKGKDKFFMPGGKREGNETDIETLIREIKEEIDLDVNNKSIEYVHTYIAQAYGKLEGVMVQMKCYRALCNNEPSASSEIEEVRYVEYKDRSILGGVAQVILDDLKSKDLID